MAIGESAITPQMQNQVASDVISPQGKQQLHQKLAQAIEEKGKLDFILQGIAKKANAQFSSRVKNPETVVQKIAQKRMEGRSYELNDVNDAYGGRIIVQDKGAIAQIASLLKKASEVGIFKINKQEEVTKDTYHAHHFDITTTGGVRGEVQIMTPQEELESVANHGLRSVFGEKPDSMVAKLQKKQAALAKNIPNEKAHAIAGAMQKLAKQNNDKPLPPQIPAALLSHA